MLNRDRSMLATWRLILDRRDRFNSFVRLIFIVAGTFLEALGVGIVFPLISALVTPGDISVPGTLSPFIKVLGLSQGEVIRVFVAAVLFVYVIKNLFLAASAFHNSKFLTSLNLKLTERLFNAYMHAPYTFHLQRNTSESLRNITSETGNIVYGVLSSGLVLASELLLAVITIGLVAFLGPPGSFSLVAFIAVAGYFYAKITRKRLLRWAELRQGHDVARFKHLQEGLGGIKAVKALCVEAFFVERFRHESEKSSHFESRRMFVTALPAYYIETVFVSLVVGFIFVHTFQDSPGKSTLPFLALVAAIGFRAMPMANRLLGAIQNIRFAWPSVRVICTDLEHFSVDAARPFVKPDQPPLNFCHQIEFRHVSFCYPGTTNDVLNDISFTIKKGTFVAIVGDSGSGKTTLVDILMGLLEPTNGSIVVDDADVAPFLSSWQRLIGYVPQSIFITDDSIRRNVAFGVDDSMIDDQQVLRALSMAGMADFVEKLEIGLDTFLGERGSRLSGGQRQRLGIARALYNQPDILVLDEATSALDSETERFVLRSVLGLRGIKTIIFITHRLTAITECDDVLDLRRGYTSTHEDTLAPQTRRVL